MGMTAAGSPPRCLAAAVLGMGASSPIGYGVRPIQAAMAGGLRNFQESSLKDADGELARVSMLSDVEETTPRAERIASLTRWAVVDLLNNVSVDLSTKIPVHVGMAADAPASDLEVIMQALAESSYGRINPDGATSFGYAEGRIAFLSAIARAIRSFEEGAGELALIAAADTRCTWHAVEALIQERRLLTARDDGTIPGEAAVVALVASPRSSVARQHAQFLVADPAFGEDQPEALCQSPQATHGLSRAFGALREHPVAGALRPAAVIAFETGELFFTRAFTTGYLRNAELMPEPLQHELIAANLGDTGAAAAGMALVRADWMMRRLESEEDQRILIYGHADDGKCAAAMAIRRPSTEKSK